MAERIITDSLIQSWINNPLFRNRFPFLTITKILNSPGPTKAGCSKCKRRQAGPRTVPNFATIRQTIAVMPPADKKDLKAMSQLTNEVMSIVYQRPDGATIKLKF